MNKHKIKLFDRLTLTNQKRIIKYADGNSILMLLKESTCFYSMELLDVVFTWWIINPDKDFDYKKFKKLFR